MRAFVGTAILGCCLMTMSADLSRAQPVLPQKQPAPGQAQTQSQSISRMTPEQFATTMQQLGYRAQVLTSNNEKYIATGMNGVNSQVYFYDCNAQGCSAVQFSARWTKDPSLTVDFCNAWNNKKRYAKAYIDPSGSMNFEYDVSYVGGVSIDKIKNDVTLYDQLLGELNKFNPSSN